MQEQGTWHFCWLHGTNAAGQEVGTVCTVLAMQRHDSLNLMAESIEKFLMDLKMFVEAPPEEPP